MNEKITCINKQYKTFAEVKAACKKYKNYNTKKIVYCKRCEAYHLLDKS